MSIRLFFHSWLRPVLSSSNIIGYLCRLLYAPFLVLSHTFWAKRGPSVAQECPSDVLEMIFADISLQDAHRCATVCEGWLEASRVRLYTSVTVDDDTPRSALLCASLRDSQLLRSYIRRVKIMQQLMIVRKKPPNLQLSSFNWILQLPPDGLWNVELVRVDDRSQEYQQLFLKSPARGHIQHLTLRGGGLGNATWIDGWLSLPRLVSLSVAIHGPIQPSLSVIPPLKRLSVVTRENLAAFAHLLIALEPTLQRFDLYISISWGDNIANFQHALGQLNSRLRHLSIDSNVKPPAQFLDDVVILLPQLEYLSCGFRTYTTAIFTRIPAKLKSLTLHDFVHSQTAPLELEDALIACDRVRKGQSDLRSLTILRRKDDASVNILREACRNVGIVFTCSPELPNRGDIPPGQHIFE